MKIFFLLSIGCVIAAKAITQPLFTYGTNEVSNEEFIKAFNRNANHSDNKSLSLKEYLELYTKYKLKVKAAKDLKLDTMEQFKFDLLNFRRRIEIDYPFTYKEAIERTNPKRNPAINVEQLYKYADSVTLLPWNHPYSIEKETVLTVAGTPVKAKEWLSFVKEYKLNYDIYRGESYPSLLDTFIIKSVCNYYRNHLEDYNTDFKYQLQEFKEGSLMFEIMNKKVWNKAIIDKAALKNYYEANKSHFLWQASAEVILVNAKYLAYADYAAESMKIGVDWRKIVDNSEGMILADSGRYEITQLPIKPGAKLLQGEFTELLKNEVDGSGSFVKIIKIYPLRQQRSFEEAKNLVTHEYQQQLEEAWLNELAKKYPVKINDAVFNSLLK